jgi:hypothetical protein
LPVDVLISRLEEALPVNSARFLFGALASEVLQSVGRSGHGLMFSFFHAAVALGYSKRLETMSPAVGRHPSLAVRKTALAILKFEIRRSRKRRDPYL